MDNAAIPSVRSPNVSSFSAQSNPSACWGKASGAGSALSASGLAGVECLEEDFDEGALGVS